MSKLGVLQKLISQKPYLIWYTKNYQDLSLEAIIEAILNYGSWQDFKFTEKTLGVKKIAQIFYKLGAQKRSNFHPLAKNYFSLYFDKYA